MLPVNPARRHAAYIAEAAFVLPVAFFLVLGLVIGAFGVFRYQEAAHLARETARFASVHAGQYAKDNAAAIKAGTLPTVDKSYLTDTIAKANAFGLDPSQLDITVNITLLPIGATSADSTTTADWDDTGNNQQRSPYSNWTDNSASPAKNVQVSNIVTVTVTYHWYPESYLSGPVDLTSTCVMAMSY